MKKAASISLLAIIFYTQLGYFGQFVIQQLILKEAAREAWVAALPDHSFYRIQLAAVEATGHWTERGRECWYQDHLYDVIRTKTERGVVWLYCMDDEREARLIRQSGELTHANQDGPDKKASHSLSPRIGDWLAETISLRLDRPLKAIDRYYGDRTRPLSAGCTETIAPPPKS